MNVSAKSLISCANKLHSVAKVLNMTASLLVKDAEAPLGVRAANWT